MAKILLVEDDSFIADIYKKKFESSGFEVLNITNGRAVLKAVDDQRFDIILLDLVIPEMSGLEVLKELRGPRYPASLPIVIFSNLSNPEDRELAVKLAQQSSLGKKRILFIEDEEVFVDMFVRKLEDEGYEVVIERNGTKGLERAQQEKNLDLIITDAMLPGINGKDLIAAIHQAPESSGIPIFVISASVDDDDMSEMLSAGAVRTYLKTKIVPSQLADEVTEFFRKSDHNQ